MIQSTWRIPSLTLLGAALAVAGCDRLPGGQASSASQPPPTPEVAVWTAKAQRVVLTTELPGRTAGYRVAEIRPQVTGLIQKRLFEEGSDVKQGEALYQIDPAPFKAAFDSAEANVEAAKKAADRARAALGASIAGVTRAEATVALARTNKARIEGMYRDRAASAFERDQAATEADVAEATLLAAKAQVESDRAAVAAAEAAISQAEAALETARINLGYTTITAPISGRIGRSNVTEGAMVTAYQSVLATIQALDPIYVDVRQSTSELTKLRRALRDGQVSSDDAAEQRKVSLKLEDGSTYPHEGTLQFRDVSVDPSTGTVILRIVAPNPDGMLLPGMFVRAVVEQGVQERAILVPQQAVTRDTKGNPLALVVDENGKVQRRALTTERAIGDRWLVTSGLAEGDRVIVEGNQRVQPGATARTVPFADPAASGPAPAPTAGGATPARTQPAAARARADLAANVVN